MDETDYIYRRRHIANLEARQELRQVEQAGLNREINSPLTSPIRRDEALVRWAALSTECGAIVQELHTLRGF